MPPQQRTAAQMMADNNNNNNNAADNNSDDDESVQQPQGNMRRVVSRAEISVGGTGGPEGRDYKVRKSSLIGYVVVPHLRTVVCVCINSKEHASRRTKPLVTEARLC